MPTLSRRRVFGDPAAAHLPPGLLYAIVESITSLRFCKLEEIAECWHTFTQGVAFGPGGELRWRRRASSAIDLVYLSEDATTLQDAEESIPLATSASPATRVILRGEVESDHAIRDGRIPHPLSYPITPPPNHYCAIEIRHYRAPARIDRVYHRFAGLLCVPHPAKTAALSQRETL